MRRFIAIAILAAGCYKPEGQVVGGDPAPPTPDAYRAEITKWQTDRAERLRAEDSWLTLVGLHWLEEGDHRLGSDPENDIVLPAGSAPTVGMVSLRDGKAVFVPAVAVNIGDKSVAERVDLLDDATSGGPTIVRIGSVRFQLLKRGDRYALRVKDAEAETRKKFTGLEYFPIDPKWRVEARIEAYHPPKQVPITDVTGMTANNVSPGALVFTVDGQEQRIDPILEGDQYFIIFKDATSRDTTYEAGRYLYADRPKAGEKVVLDFNRAYNPPCVFTPYATCPLPPPQNRLAIRIEAGEKKYH